jgi:hypothetical protein
MPANIYDMICEQGTTFVRVVTYTDSNNSPINISSYTGRMKVRKSKSSTEEYLSLTTGGGGLVLQSNGEIEITIPAVTSAKIPSGNYRYDLEIISTSGIVTRVIEGEFKVSGEVTR